jgi:hypothetical protein
VKEKNTEQRRGAQAIQVLDVVEHHRFGATRSTASAPPTRPWLPLFARRTARWSFFAG